MALRPLILWHRADFDGVCSAAIAKKFVPDAELHGIDYGDEFPWDKVRPGPDAVETEPWASNRKVVESHPGYSIAEFPRRTVYLLDFSLPPEDMKKLAACCDLVWIDHHKVCLDMDELTK